MQFPQNLDVISSLLNTFMLAYPCAFCHVSLEIMLRFKRCVILFVPVVKTNKKTTARTLHLKG